MHMSVADANIPLFKVFMAPPEELDGPLLSVIHSGMVTQGPKVEEFEAALREFFLHQHVLTLNSATSGLHLALHLIQKPDGPNWPGLQPEVDEVLTCPLTCTATNWPILANRLRIKWVDADPKTANMCLEDLEAKLSPTTKVIMIVHWGGVPADLDRIARIQQTCFQKFGFIPHVIEDCAHSMGAEHQGRKLGTHGNICVFSLQVRRRGCMQRTQRMPPPPLPPPPPRYHHRRRRRRDRRHRRAPHPCTGHQAPDLRRRRAHPVAQRGAPPARAPAALVRHRPRAALGRRQLAHDLSPSSRAPEPLTLTLGLTLPNRVATRLARSPHLAPT